jgi:hypothetical protein
MDFENFLTQQEADTKGRTLQDIWNFTDTEIERTHDFIQIIFPLDEPSGVAPQLGYLESDSTVAAIKANDLAKANIIISSRWFLSFLKMNEQWKKPYDHNHSRITRIIRCLRLLVSDEVADEFRRNMLDCLGSSHVISKRTLKFWDTA